MASERKTNGALRNPAPIRRRKLYEDVVARLEELIHTEELKPGDPLPSERDLMQQFGVGRPAIREALFALSRMGLVEVASGERPRVSSPTPRTLLGELSGAARLMLSKPEGVHHFQEARSLFESALAEEAARFAARGDVLALERALQANKQAIGDLVRFQQTDVAFHLAIASIPRNPIYLALHAAIAEWLNEQRSVSLRQLGVDEVAYASHRTIFEAIKEKEPDSARKAMRSHLEQISELYWKIREGKESSVKISQRP
jgi:GntR family transcriptional regulator, sialic acid-inducible nan operon repressor